MAYQRKTIDRWDIMTNYGYGWECENSEYTWRDAKRSYKEYRDNTNADVRLVKRREKKIGRIARQLHGHTDTQNHDEPGRHEIL